MTTHTDHPMRHWDRTCPACNEGATSMTDLRKAAEMALEALLNYPLTEGRAIQTLRQALAQPDKPLRLSPVYEYGHIHEASHPEQEPVTWRNAAIRLGEDLYSVGPDGYYDMTAKEWLDWALSVVTAPPSKQWVGLTDEEIKGILDCGRGGLVDIKKAEQILKEKNGGSI